MIRIDENAAVQRVTELIAIHGGSGQETEVSDYVQRVLQSAGVPTSALAIDTAHRRSPIGGDTGNLIVKLRGTKRGPRRLLMAHMDTVPLAVDSVPFRDGDWIRPKSDKTALGADDRSGCAVILTAILELIRQGIDHPPLTLLFTVQEEIGLVGARHLSAGKLGNPKLCFNWDGRDPLDLIIGAVGATYVNATVSGIASHAGVHPDDGVNAAIVASLALADLQENGWHGLVVMGRQRGTSNIGIVQGGAATNVVMPEIKVTAEARSHSRTFRAKIVREYRKAFDRAAKQLRNADGRRASIHFAEDTRYEPFRIPKSAHAVRAAMAAAQSCGLTAQTSVCNGGLDANWMAAHGYPAVTLGCGQHHIHTVDERLNIPEFLQACQIACQIACGD